MGYGRPLQIGNLNLSYGVFVKDRAEREPDGAGPYFSVGPLPPGQIRVQHADDAPAAAKAIQPGQAVWSDRSRLENGRTGAGNCVAGSPGRVEHPGFPLGLRQEVFNADLLGDVQALKVARRIRINKPITILLDSQEAISRLQHTRACPSRSFALQAYAVAGMFRLRGDGLHPMGSGPCGNKWH